MHELNELQLRTITFDNFDNFGDSVYCYMMYQNQLQKYAGKGGPGGYGVGTDKVRTQKEKFLKIFDFWCEQDQSGFVLFLIQEKLTPMKDHLISLL